MKRVFWSIADNNNLKYFDYLKKSFKKFHPNEELILFGEQEIKATNDPYIFYRATPYFTKRLMEEGYDLVVKMDADQIVCSSLDEIWQDEDWDVKTVLNSNPRELKQMVVTIFDLNPLMYFNCGFVIMKNKAFVDKWWQLCNSSHFGNYQYREQDILNIMCEFGGWKVKCLDAGDSFWGLGSKGFWAQIELRGDKLILPKNEEWNLDDKKIKVLHWGGGNVPKMGDINIRFQSEVAKYLQELIK